MVLSFECSTSMVDNFYLRYSSPDLFIVIASDTIFAFMYLSQCGRSVWLDLTCLATQR